jgi:hypothetical protein
VYFAAFAVTHCLSSKYVIYVFRYFTYWHISEYRLSGCCRPDRVFTWLDLPQELARRETQRSEQPGDPPVRMTSRMSGWPVAPEDQPRQAVKNLDNINPYYLRPY